MANDLIKFADDADPGFGAYNEVDDDSLADGIGVSYPLIKYKGKVWSLQYKGKNHIITDPTTGYASPFIDVVVLNGAGTKSKAYFENWEEGSHDRPLCTSMDSIVPDEGVVAKQSETCGLCDRNKFHLNAKGKNVRDCSDYKRLSVLVLPSITERILGFPLLEPIFLRVPGGSLTNLSEMDTQARMRGLKYWAFVTRIDFDPNESYPKMQFTGVKKLEAAERPAIEQLRADPRNAAVIGLSRSQGGMKVLNAPPNPGPVETLNREPAAPAPQVAPVVRSTAQADMAAKLAADREARIAAIRAESEPQPKSQGPILDLKATVVTAAAAPAPAPAPAPVLTGIIQQAAPAPAPVVPASAGGVPVGQFAAPDRSTKPPDAVSDTGEPEMADADIDARLAAMDLTA
jgi:hypothetical protein